MSVFTDLPMWPRSEPLSLQFTSGYEWLCERSKLLEGEFLSATLNQERDCAAQAASCLVLTPQQQEQEPHQLLRFGVGTLNASPFSVLTTQEHLWRPQITSPAFVEPTAQQWAFSRAFKCSFRLICTQRCLCSLQLTPAASAHSSTSSFSE